MILTPLPGKLLVEPILQTEVKKRELQKSAPSLVGLELAKPDNKRHGFEGIPDRGTIYALPDDYDGELELGMEVIFNEQNPKAVKYDGLKLFSLELKQIMAVVANG